MKIRAYIESGVLESYVLGSASTQEIEELLQLKKQHPEIEDALFELETDIERLAQYGAITPPPGMFTRIEDGINALINTPPEALPEVISAGTGNGYTRKEKGSQFIEVESESNHMRVHKTWKWVLAAVFVLSKLFLIGFIYFYLANKQAQEQIQELKTELKQYKIVR